MHLESMVRVARVSLLAILLAGTPALAEDEEATLKVGTGRTVSVEYTLTLDDGTVADTNVGRDPLTFELGAGQMLPGFEQGIAGASAGESREFELPPEAAYGPVRADLKQEVPLDAIPEDARQVGAVLVAQAETGDRRRVEVLEVTDTHVVVDLNHPLAGRTLKFQVKVLAIQ
ncbi:MAG: peptidylprolyl isomerase [Myxococcota bacterium]